VQANLKVLDIIYLVLFELRTELGDCFLGSDPPSRYPGKGMRSR
jgi:hypothetical protein